MGLWDMLEEEPQEEVEEVKEEVKEVEEAIEEAVEVPAPKEEAPVEETKVAKKETKPKSKSKPKSTAKNDNGGFLYPFVIYTEGRSIDVDNYGFEDGKTYKENEITKIMLAHKHYEFSGTMEYSFIEEDNVIVANAKQHKKG